MKSSYIVIGVIIVIIIVLKIVYDRKSYKTKARYKLKAKWGEVPNHTYSEEKLQSIGHYYRTVVKRDSDVDDITWNDLDMDQIFMTLNNATCSIGEEYLYAMLHSLKFDDKKLKERDRLADYFSENEEDRLKLQVEFARMGRTKNISIHEYINRLDDVEPDNNMVHYGKIIMLLGAITCIFINPFPGIIATIAIILVNIVTYFKRKTQIEKYFTVVSYIIRWLDSVKEISSFKIDIIKPDIDKLLEIHKKFRQVRTGATVVAPKTASGDLLQMFIDYIRMFTHIDLIKFNKMVIQLKRYKKDLNTMFSIIGKLDASMAIASFRELLGEYCKPELTAEGGSMYETENVYHPMLNDPVKNSIKEHKSTLLTGSNASGKSTFIKTLAINAILAQTIYTVAADSYKASFFKVMSSMALQDNIQSGESYYIVEIKSLKRIVDSLNDDYPVLCFVDEVLRGTNTIERIAASSRILKNLATSNAMSFAATHDIELTYILEKYYSNYHFQEQVVDNQVLFDYILYEGRAVSRNAIKLLTMIGYTKAITEEADKAVEEFLEVGEWKVM